MNSTLSFETGTLFLKAGASAPSSLVLRGDPFISGWEIIDNSRSVVDGQIQDAAWTYFFLAGEMKSTTLGFDPKKTLVAGLRRLADMTKVLRCNSFEISGVTHKRFLGLSRVSLSCHARHLQKGHLLYSE